MSTTVRKPCPITLPQFEAAAPRFSCSLGAEAAASDGAIHLEPREASTGSVGLGGQGKINVMVGGKSVPCQVGANFTVIGSKTWSPERKAAVLAKLKPDVLKLYFHEAAEIPLGEVQGTLMAPFSTGSFGWGVNAKQTVSGEQIQVGINVTVIGSKP